MRTYLTTAAVAALAWLPPAIPAIPAAAQEATVAEALEYLQRGERVDGVSANEPAVHILRQVDQRGGPSPSTAAELDAFADRLAEIAADATLPEDVRWEATGALLSATVPKAEHGFGGTPYPRAFDLLVEVYEGGYDDALYTIMRADSVRGPAYVRELFERSERPPLCHRGGGYEPAQLSGATIQGIPVVAPLPLPPECEGYSFRRDARDTPWCESGGYLFGGIVDEAWERTPGGRAGAVWGGAYPDPVPEGLPKHVEDWHRRCR